MLLESSGELMKTVFVENGEKFIGNNTNVRALDEMGNIQVIGNSNRISTYNSSIMGNSNVIYGHNNCIYGNNNTAYGIGNPMYGNSNQNVAKLMPSVLNHGVTTSRQNNMTCLVSPSPLNVHDHSVIAIKEDDRNIQVRMNKFPTKEELQHDQLLTNDHDPDTACVICLERKRKCVIRPCKHYSLCIKCSTQELTQCPVCREKIECIERLF